MIGTQILHYNIKEKLGEGGMGVVYLAEDTKLERMVAIKSLPQRIAGNAEERERFKIEAKAAASLNHPNISTIHNIEDIDDQLYIVMEYIDGKELKDEVRSRKLEVGSVLDIAIQIARGLEAAHKKGIVHRDIKAGNIMVTSDGQVKIMDFGLAKVQGSEQLTREGTTIGTAAYMSPEQASHGEVDAQSDIWSFGVIIYEMLTGKLPFKGDYEAAILYDIVHANPESLQSIKPELPGKLIDIVDRCLQKDKSKRYHAFSEIVEDLKSLQSDSKVLEPSSSSLSMESQAAPSVTATSLDKLRSNQFHKRILIAASFLILTVIVVSFFLMPDNSETNSENVVATKKMLVVLPFKNLGDAEQEYFADGITGEITSRLSGLSGLGVIARSSAMQYKNSTKSIKQIGEELGVQYLLDGTIQWELLADGSKRVRVNPELIQISNATQIWSKPYESDFSSVFKLQSEIATQVASAMDITLLSGEEKSIEQELTTNSEAFDYYLRGLEYHLDTYDLELWQIAIQMYNRAIDLDPQFAAAFARISNLHSDMYWFHYDRTDNRLKMAWEAIQKAERINPSLYILHTAKGWYYYHGFLEYDTALKEFYKSLEFQPNDEDAYMGIASVLRRQGKVEESATVFKKAISMNPRSSLNYDQLGETQFLLRQYDEAQKNLERSISLAPDDAVAYPFLAWIFVINENNIKKARNLLEDHLKNAGSLLDEFQYNLTRFDIFERKFDDALNQLDKFEELSNQFRYIPKDMLKARVYGFKNEDELMRKSYRKSLQTMNTKIKEQPNDERLYSTLGIIYAGLGDKQKAIEYGKQGVKLLPVSKEAWRGSFRELDMAIIYTMIGEKEKAIELLNQLLSRPFDLSVTWLKFDPLWDPLRDNPRFLSLLEKHSRN
jgi:serine/threonine protein kinase/Tfp pilus assembly protein PilF